MWILRPASSWHERERVPQCCSASTGTVAVFATILYLPHSLLIEFPCILPREAKVDAILNRCIGMSG